MNNFFTLNQTFYTVLLQILIALVLGTLVSLSYIFSNKKGDYSQSFAVTVFALPVIVAIVITLVGSDIAKAVSLGGVFALVRFRSVPGNSKDILFVFFAMSVGLAVGVNYYPVALVLTIVIGLIFVLNFVIINKKGSGQKFELKITVPENMNFYAVFDEILVKYCTSYTMKGIKTSNMGTIFILSYDIILKDLSCSKQMFDELRIRNGNLNILLNVPAQEERL